MTIAVGVTSFNRPEYLEKCLKALVKQLGNTVDHFYVYNDGSDTKHRGAYARSYKPLERHMHETSDLHSFVMAPAENKGVAVAKNMLLKQMLKDGADWCFLCEDDIIIKSPEAVTSYIAAAESSNFQHLSFAHHGPANAGGPVRTDDVLGYYPHSVGAWCLYSAKALDDVGMFDENFVCAWEHVELTLRLAQAGYTSGAYEYADVMGSSKWLAEIPGSIEKSSIRPRDDWQRNIRDGLQYWHDNKPETFELLFGSGLMLENYAKQVLR